MNSQTMKPIKPRARKTCFIVWGKKWKFYLHHFLFAGFSSSDCLTIWGIPFKIVYFYLPVLIISLYIVVMMLHGKYEDKKYRKNYAV